MRKLFSEIGETIVETLVATLVIVLVFAFLANAVVTAARVNNSVKSDDVAFALPEDGATSGGSVSITIAGTAVQGQLYEVPYGEDDESRYYYYEYNGS